MVTRRDYTAEAVEAAKRVLIELVHRLGEYRNGVVVVGGWVPYLLLANHEQSRTPGAWISIWPWTTGGCGPIRRGRGGDGRRRAGRDPLPVQAPAERGDRRGRHPPVARRRAHRNRLRAVPLHPFPLFAPAFFTTSTTRGGSWPHSAGPRRGTIERARLHSQLFPVVLPPGWQLLVFPTNGMFDKEYPVFSPLRSGLIRFQPSPCERGNVGGRLRNLRYFFVAIAMRMASH